MNKNLIALSASAILLSLSLAACDGTPAANLPADPQASNSPATEDEKTDPAAEASAEPGDSAAPTGDASTLPNENPAAEENTDNADEVPSNSKLKVTGAEVFNQFPVSFKTGMKWVYALKAPAIDIPGLPAGFTPPTGGDLGTMTQEVISVQGNTVTLKVDVNSSGVNTSNESSFETNSTGDYYNSSFAGDGEGTLTWSSAGTESVTVEAGTYSATKIKGAMDVTTTQNGVTAQLKQDITLWMASGVGMVKQEVSSTTDSPAGQVNSTNVTELKSFSG